jgi:hypothetical protein
MSTWEISRCSLNSPLHVSTQFPLVLIQLHSVYQHGKCFRFNKYKTFSMLIYTVQFVSTLVEMGKQEIVWKHDARRAES